MTILIQLISRYLNFKDLKSTCKAFSVDLNEISNFYFNETLFLTDEDRKSIQMNSISYPLYLRMYDRDLLFDFIINNEFMDNKLKVQIYNGIKHNNPKFLELYKQFFPMLIGKTVEVWSDMNAILPLLPLKFDNYEFSINDITGEFLIFFNNKCIGRNKCSDTVKIIEHYGIEHIVTLLKSPLILESIMLYSNCNKQFERIPILHAHKRPRLRK